MPDWGETPELDPSLQKAAGHLAAGETAEALAALRPLIASGAPDLAPRFLLGMLAWRMGRLDWALGLVRECHELDPMDGVVAETLASLLAQSGDVVECIYIAKLATALGSAGPLGACVPSSFPSFPAAFAAISERPKLAQAKRERAAGAYEAAMESARQHAALAPRDPEGRAFHAALLLEAGRAGDAVESMRAVADRAAESAPLASLYARCLAACGESAAARDWHDVAGRLAPDDLVIEAARIADGLWLDDAAELARRGAAWARRFCPPSAASQWRRPEGRLVIAYLVNALADAEDAAAIAAVARAHDRRNATVIAYAAGAQSWRRNLALTGSFDRWQDVGALDGATLARYIAHDGADIVIDASGFNAPQGLLALARVSTALRVSWLGNPAGLLRPVFDARIAAASDAGEGTVWRIAGGYPVPQAQAAALAPRETIQFGADIALPQLDDETVALWSGLLDARPEAKLLLRARDTSRGAVDRLVARFGTRRASRIDLVTAERFEEFYVRVDLALLPRRGVSPRSAAEAAACGVPALAFAGSARPEPYGGFLRSWEGARLANSAEEYLARACAIAARGEAGAASPDAAAFAHAIEENAVAALSLGAAA